MTAVIAIGNQKGGVGKTTTAINLAGYYARRGQRVLVLDLDGQGHVAPSFGMPKANGLYRLLVLEESISQVSVQARDNIWIIQNDHTCEMAKEHVKQANFREYMLANVLADATDYDLVLIDTPPSTDVLHVLALVASDFAIIPANLDHLALDGVNYILKTLRTLGRYPGVTPPVLIGVLPTKHDKVTGETVRNIQALQQAIGANLILPPIPSDTKVREASAHGQMLWEFAPRCQAAIGFKNGAKLRNSAGLIGGYLHVAEITESIIQQAK